MYTAADFSLPFGDTAGGLRDTVSYTSRQFHTHKHMWAAVLQSMQHFSRKSAAVNISPLHTKNYVYFHLESFSLSMNFPRKN